MPVYTPVIGTGINNNYSFSTFSTSPPVSGSVYTIDGAGGTDTFVFAKGVTYLNKFLSTGFTIAPADASGVIVVTGASAGGTQLTFNLKSVEQLVFGNGTVQLLYPAPDTTPPTVAVTSDKSTLLTGQTAAITFTFSEDPGTSFTASDITLAGGTLGALSGTGLVRTALFTPTPGLASGTATIAVANASYTDAAGNAGSAGTTPAISIDTLAPTVAITSSTAALSAGQTAAITFTFSEDPGTSFTASDITLAGGTLGALSGTGLVRTATFTPTPGLASGTATIAVANASYTDAAGNTGSAGATPVISIDTAPVIIVDTTPPTVAITSSTAALSAGQTAAITFTFSEDPGTSFTASDITLAGGTLGALSGTGLVRTATFTPTPGLASGTATIAVVDASYTDAAGNAGSAGTTPVIIVDTTPPTVAITSSTAALSAGQTAAITFTFSEDPGTSFTTSDITLAGGTLGALSGTGLVRTALFTPTPSLASGTATIAVANASYTDAAGNTGSAGATPVISIDTAPVIIVDTTPPTVAITSSTAALSAGQTAAITFTFSEDPGTSFTASDITLAGGTLGALSGTGLVRTATFTPTPGLASGTATIAVANASYTDAAGNTGSAGATPVISIDTAPVIIVDTTPPTVAITSSTAALSAGQTAAITFTFSEDPGTSFTASDITLAGGTLGALSGTGLVRTALFTPTPGLASGTATIAVVDASYTDAAGNTGSAGATPVISIDTAPVIIVDTTPPTVAITSSTAALSAGQTAAITFTFSEDPGTSFTASDITLAGGTLGALSGTGLVRTALFTPTPGLASGTATIAVANASYTDAAGNAGSAGATPVININTATGTTVSDSDREQSNSSSDNHVDHSIEANHDYSSNHIIFGNSRDNILDGRGGNYTMQGGAGNDTYIVDSVGDVVKESARQGVDTVKASVTHTLGANVEKLTLTGHDAINGTGNERDNIITGNSGNNILNGGAGHDVLTGGEGNDILTGGSGADYFVFNVKPNAGSNIDTVTDFQRGTDELLLSKAIFTALASRTGELRTDKFWSSATADSAHDSSDRIIYNTTTGALYYDADGIGGVAAVQVAIIGTVVHPSLHASDIHIIA